MYRKKNAIYTPIIKINNKLNTFFKKYNFIKLNNIDNNIDIDEENDDEEIIEEDQKKIKLTSNWTISIEKCVTIKYKNQLKTSSFTNEDEIEDINIINKNNRIQYCSIDLLLKKIIEDNSFNIEIYLNPENRQTFNLINAFIYQCFGFITYEILIKKLLEMYKYYKYQNKLNNTKNARLVKLIFKITNFLFDHKIYNFSYFQFSDELIITVKKFLEENIYKKEIKALLDYKKEKKDLENNNIYKNKNNNLNDSKSNTLGNIGLTVANTFINYPHGEFVFNILKYNEEDIALILTNISIKNFINLYNHLYELNPTIKKKEDKPHLLALSDFSNKLSNFLIEESLSYDLLSARVSIVEKIIDVLIELKNKNNFNDLFSVYSALISISIKLAKTWSQINPKQLSKFKEIKNLCSAQNCYKNIREEENKCMNEGKFYIPYIVITTKHINFYDEGTKYVGDNGLVCIEKIIVNQKEIEEFRNELRFLIKRKNTIKIKNSNNIKELKTVFYNLNPKDYDSLENLSQKIEPEFTLYKEPDNRKRNTKTDSYINSCQFINIK